MQMTAIILNTLNFNSLIMLIIIQDKKLCQ